MSLSTKFILCSSFIFGVFFSMNSEADKKPPWLVNPDAERYSISWRMGGGEDYLREWWLYFNALSHEESILYQEQYPEPESWEGFYKKEHPLLSEEERKLMSELKE